MPIKLKLKLKHRPPANKLEIIDVKISDMKPAIYNPRKISDHQLNHLKKSLQKFKVVEPIVLNSNPQRFNNVIGGHQRIKAATSLGWNQLPCTYTNLNEQDEKELNIRLNKNTGEFDLDILITEFELPDLIDFGFTTDELDLNIEDIINDNNNDPDVTPILSEDPATTQKGDLYKLGDHFLLCGDATKEEDIQTLTTGNKINITFTSPPYNANKNAGGLIKQKYQDNDDAMDNDEYLKFLKISTDIMLNISDYVFINIQMLSHNKIPLFNFQTYITNYIKDILIWVKNISPPQINKGTFNSKWEYLFCLSKNDFKSRSFPCDWRGKYYNVIEVENASRNKFADVHKATFPVAFPLWLFEKLGFVQTVFDPFGGTGTTMIACEKTKRKCYMMEISPKYCDVIIKRWEEYTEKKAELIQAGTNIDTRLENVIDPVPEIGESVIRRNFKIVLRS